MVALRRILVLAALASLAGCASTSEFAKSRGGHHNDADYMYAVESIARQKGVQVVWINPPSEEGTDYLQRSR